MKQQHHQFDTGIVVLFVYAVCQLCGSISHIEHGKRFASSHKLTNIVTVIINHIDQGVMQFMNLSML